jgi:hypothetical protein
MSTAEFGGGKDIRRTIPKGIARDSQGTALETTVLAMPLDLEIGANCQKVQTRPLKTAL